MIQLFYGDCLEVMPALAAKSVDMVLCDLPYGTTARHGPTFCKWDTVIPFAPLWAAYRHVLGDTAAAVLNASEPFTSALVSSNFSNYRHRWTWDKVKPSSGLRAKMGPLRVVEDIVVFYGSRYYPQMVPKKPRQEWKNDSNGEAFGGARLKRYHDNGGLGYPKDLLVFSNADQTKRVHPTQKPVALMEYLIRTYTNPGDTVLDNCMGSGTTGVACINTGRSFIGIEKEKEYFDIAQQRLGEAQRDADLALFGES